MPDLPDSFLLEPTPHAEAAKWLRNKPAVSREVFDGLLPELRARAILVTGVEDAAVVGEIRDILAELPAGLPWEEAKKQLVSKLGPWIGADADDPAGAQKAREARAELLLRTHGFQAYQVTQHAVMRRQEDVFPFWQYLSSGDEKVRPAHAALNDVVAPAGSDFWADHSPPWQWGCRCRKVPLLPEEVDEIKAAEASKPPEARKVLEGSALRRAENGILDRGPARQFDIRSDRMRGKPGGYVFDPDSLAMPLDQLESRYDAQTWGEFRKAMEVATLPDGRTAWGWLNGQVIQKGARQAAAKVAKVALVPGGKARRPDGVASKVDASARNTAAANAQLEDMLGAIDAVHGDGPLRRSVVRQGAGSSGYYAPGSSEIKWGKSGLWAQQIVHEIGHKIDFEALPGQRLIRQDWPEVDAFWKTVKASKAYAGLHDATLLKRNGRKYMRYLQEPSELWARAYAQFIAEESGNVRLTGSIAERLGGGAGYPAASQWTAEDFAPIRASMQSIFQRLQWYDPS